VVNPAPVLLCVYAQSYLEEEVKINEYDDSVVKVGTFTGSW
jgi:hypothetical protein